MAELVHNNRENDDVVVSRSSHNLSDGVARLLAGLALIVAIVALVFAWQAYERTGADLDERIEDAASAAAEDTRNAASEAADGVENAAGDAADALDAGPDGVDEDDTDVQQTN